MCVHVCWSTLQKAEQRGLWDSILRHDQPRLDSWLWNSRDGLPRSLPKGNASSFIISIGPSQKANTRPPRPLCQSCHLMLLPHFLARNSPSWSPPSLLTFWTLLYSHIVIYICEWIWEKGLLHAETKFLFLIVHNFKAVIAMDLKPGITILQSLCCTCYKLRALPSSGLGLAIASITSGRKSAVLCLLLVPTISDRKIATLLMLDFFSRRAGVPINQDRSLRLLVSSSYNRLKTVKFWRFA